MSSSVALVVLDTVRKDAFDEHFDWLNGLSFSSALSPSHWTTPVHAAMFAGAYPTEIGVHAKNPVLDVPDKTIAEKLQESGWTCRGYSANGNISPSTGFDRGFDKFTAKGYHSSADIFDWQTFITNSEDHWSRFPRAVKECIKSDCDTIPSLKRGLQRKYDDLRYGGSPNLSVEDALEYIRDQSFGEREFFFLNLMEAHPKYFPPEEYRMVEPFSINSVEALEAYLRPEADLVNEEHMWKTYNDSVRYLSEYYRRIHGVLSENFDYIITVSDHGEAFGKDGVYGHIPVLTPEIVHVPVSITGDVPEEELSESVSLVDVHQTIASLTGVQGAVRGQNLLEAEDEANITESHGLSRWQRQELMGYKIDKERLDEVNTLHRGFSTGDYYGYESVNNGWIDAQGERLEPQNELECLVAGFKESDSNQHSEIRSEVKNQLRDMGYI